MFVLVLQTYGKSLTYSTISTSLDKNWQICLHCTIKHIIVHLFLFCSSLRIPKAAHFVQYTVAGSTRYPYCTMKEPPLRQRVAMMTDCYSQNVYRSGLIHTGQQLLACMYCYGKHRRLLEFPLMYTDQWMHLVFNNLEHGIYVRMERCFVEVSCCGDGFR